MRVHVIWPGKTKNAHLRAVIDDYLKRISHFVRCDITELRGSSGAEGGVGIDRESKRISDALSKDDVSILLDPEGSEWSSEELAERIKSWENAGTKSVAFIVGGPDGVSAELLSNVDQHWSLSRLTFTHETARVLLLEQIYRAYAINRGLPYVK
jgi:23S rRNA (pseudouridine1915-N3)-methyltransferase